MKKGNTGISLNFYAIMAFVLAIIGSYTLGGLLLGFVIIVEKDEWLNIQAMQAFVLSLASMVFGYVLSSISSGLRSIPLIGVFLTGGVDFASLVIDVIIIILVIGAIINTGKGKDANIPIIGGWIKKFVNQDAAV